MKRRNFLTHFGLGWLSTWAGAVVIALSNRLPNGDRAGMAAASTPKPTSTSETTKTMATLAASGAKTSTFVQAGTVKALDKEGFLTVKGKNASAVIVRNPQNSKTLYAVNSACTHKGCAVKWNAQSKDLVCPCHNSVFKADGTVQKGPASKPLQRYEAKIEGTEVLIQWT